MDPLIRVVCSSPGFRNPSTIGRLTGCCWLRGAWRLRGGSGWRIVFIDSAAVFGSLAKRLVPHRALNTFIEICVRATHLDSFGVPLPICPVREKRSGEVAMSEEGLPQTRSLSQAVKAPEKNGLKFIV